LRPISGVTTTAVTGITMLLNNVSTERNAAISFRVDGLDYEVALRFVDETLEHRTLRGGVKRKAKPEIEEDGATTL